MRTLLALTVGATGVLATLLALAQQAPPSRNVDDYVLIGLTRVSLGSGARVLAGNVGAIERGRIRPHGRTSRLGLKSLLAAQGLSDVNPLREDVFLQIRAERGDEVFCAKVPAGRFVVKRPGVFRFRDREHIVGPAGGIDRLTVGIAGNGSVRFRAVARNAQFASPRDRPLNVTVSFRNALEAEGGNRCSTSQGLRTNRRGALRVP